jgi:hypothetical protein
MVWNIGPENEYDAGNVMISFVGIIRKEYAMQQQCYFVFISRRVATKKTS